MRTLVLVTLFIAFHSLLDAQGSQSGIILNITVKNDTFQIDSKCCEKKKGVVFVKLDTIKSIVISSSDQFDYHLIIKNQAQPIGKLIDRVIKKKQALQIPFAKSHDTIFLVTAEGKKQLASSFKVVVNELNNPAKIQAGELQITGTVDPAGVPVSPDGHAGTQSRMLPPSGIPIYDALLLNRMAKNPYAKDSILVILNYYLTNENNITSYEAALEKYQKNNFIRNYIEQVKIIHPDRGKAESALPPINFSSALSSIGGLDVTSIAYGLADFLVKRTREELNVAFFTRFTETLNDPKYADLRVLFPNTWELLQAIGTQIYDYNKYIQNLREAFTADIISLDVTLPGIIPNHSAFFDKNFGLAVSLNTACYLTASLKNQVHPGEILDNYPLELYFKKEGQTEYFNKNWSGAIQTLQLISLSLRDSSVKSDNYWVSFQKVKELISNKDAFLIYLGLIYQVAKNERFNNIQYQQGSFVDLLNEVKIDRDFVPYKNFISNFAVKVNNLNQMIKNHSKPANDSAAFEKYAKYFKSSVDLLECCTTAASLPGFDKVIHVSLHDQLKNYFKITYETTDLACDINRKNYSSAINHAVTIYNLVRTKQLKTDLDNLSVTAGIQGNGTPVSSNKKEKAEKQYNKAVSKYVKMVYGSPLSDSVTVKVVPLPDSTTLARKSAQLDSLVKYTGSLLTGIPAAKTDSEKINALMKQTGTLLNEINADKKTTAQKGSVLNRVNDPIVRAAFEDSLKNSKDLLEKLTIYGTFMSTIATAKNPGDVEKAIESASLPSGSSRIKRETPFNVCLNAYTGLFIGHEKIVGMQDKLLINNYGITAPIGVSISTGGHSFAFAWPGHEGHWSYSAFISLIDIGAVASFRFQNSDSVAQVPTIKLMDIFSPGLFFSIGLPKCPLSLNFGAQVGPNLRNVNGKDDKGNVVNLYQDNVYWRFSASLAVDIPIFNFYTRSRH